ncbi:hypothetical protein J7E91_23030 [Streptomyces sp. ISL-99]|uniref:hypothetical protein n=1 Tax=Streptomyces sp. ISL-99 TaxID=2819193 RepID=UPI001BE97CFD|nr:hypothetical protein [Streptomyces sp. ISL-99]MBT2528208.1 hypothetical protein [Streptomyces sp. ISL-99]
MISSHRLTDPAGDADGLEAAWATVPRRRKDVRYLPSRSLIENAQLLDSARDLRRAVYV